MVNVRAMTRGTRIVAIDAGDPQGTPLPETAEMSAEPLESAAEQVWEEEAVRPSRPVGLIVGALLTVCAIAGWTALFVFANLAEMQVGTTLAQWTGWIRDWSVPVLLVAVVWLLAMRNSRREAVRFGETAALLSTESERLETRLTTVNRELSLAREFIASQSRDLETLGRVAAERLSENAGQLSSLIADNGTRLESIQTVSAAALENMETLRGHLPVIASSAKDVSNNIANAGRTANAQIEELITGFNRLNQFGQASERQVTTLRGVVDTAIAEFTRQTDYLGEVAEQRFVALAERGVEFRTQLEAHEVEALAGIRNRATALADELEEARKILDVQESDSLTSLRARLTAVRDESAALVRSLREGESNALDAWKIAIVQLEDDLTGAIARVAEIDDKAMASARNRLDELAREAAEVDNRMAERDRAFADEIERRRADFEERHGAFVSKLAGQLEGLDEQIAARRAAHEEQGRKLVGQGEMVTGQLEVFARKLDEVAELGGIAESKVAQSLAALGDKLSASREALSGTDVAIAQLTDGSVRLLELIQASVQHSKNDLPAAMGASETKLAEIETRVLGLKTGLNEAESSGERVSTLIVKNAEGLDLSLRRIEALGSDLELGSSRQVERLEAITTSLEKVRSESLALAEQSQSELRTAIDELNQSARDAVMGIGTISASAISEIAAKLGAESSAAIDQAMRSRTEEVASQLELAAARAAGASRDAAIQLRDQLAKVSELTNHLEQRVAHARTRAEEQVDNDFARRVALITESLNSNAIDIARAMDSEVTDTAWGAYLKGDRGIFTRRAVRLLDNAEAKAVAQLYEDDRGFADHVSRYIHDFEAMLRQLLSTRDGHALGVTLLSSDMGKLYVALAQAIERLRN